MTVGKKSIIRRWETQVGIGVAVICFSVLGVFLGLKIGGKETAKPVEVAQTEGVARVEETARAEKVSQAAVVTRAETVTQTEAAVQVGEQPLGIPDLGKPYKEEINLPSATHREEGESVEPEDALVQGPGEALKVGLEESEAIEPSFGEAFEGMSDRSPAAEFSPEGTVPGEGSVGAGTKGAEVAVSYPKSHKVKPNDTLMGIAKEYYGDVSKWVLIYEVNGLLDRNRLMVGQDLIIPAPDYEVKQESLVKRVSFSDSGSPGVAHRVQQGDTLKKLARVYYDDESQWRRIYDANKGHLSGRETLKPGEVIVIP